MCGDGQPVAKWVNLEKCIYTQVYPIITHAARCCQAVQNDRQLMASALSRSQVTKLQLKLSQVIGSLQFLGIIRLSKFIGKSFFYR